MIGVMSEETFIQVLTGPVAALALWPSFTLADGLQHIFQSGWTDT